MRHGRLLALRERNQRDKSEDSAVAVALRLALAQLHGLAERQGFERDLGRQGGVGSGTAAAKAFVTKNWRRWCLDAGEPDFAAVVERKAAAIGHGDDPPRADDAETAGFARCRSHRPSGRRGRRQRSRKAQCNDTDADPPAHADTEMPE
jgi:hypothetical protein